MADPYADQDYADDYFENERVITDAWDEATDVQKGKALLEATRRIDRLRFAGIKLDSSQELEWPRNSFGFDFPAGGIFIPDDILKANCELAYSLLDGVEPEIEIDNTRRKLHVYSGVRSLMDTSIPAEAVVAGIPSHMAWSYLKPYLADPKSISTKRV